MTLMGFNPYEREPRPPRIYGSTPSQVTIHTTSQSRNYEKERRDMARETAAQLERRLQNMARVAAELEGRLAEAKAQESRRVEEPPVDTVISWEYKFEGNSKVYTYVAIRFADYKGRCWTIAGPRGQGVYYTWDELQDFIFAGLNPDNGQVYVVTGWGVLA